MIYEKGRPPRIQDAPAFYPAGTKVLIRCKKFIGWWRYLDAIIVEWSLDGRAVKLKGDWCGQKTLWVLLTDIKVLSKLN